VIWTGQGKAKLEASGCREAHGQRLLLVADGATRRWWVRLAVAPWIGTRIRDRGTQIGSRFRGVGSSAQIVEEVATSAQIRNKEAGGALR
jgi:hypothetical protein